MMLVDASFAATFSVIAAIRGGTVDFLMIPLLLVLLTLIFGILAAIFKQVVATAVMLAISLIDKTL